MDYSACGCSVPYVKGYGTNQCSANYGEIIQLSDFAGVTYDATPDSAQPVLKGTNAADKICHSIGGSPDNFEWEYDNFTDSTIGGFNPNDRTQYCPSDNTTPPGSGYCKNGRGASCRRVNFTGNPVDCCLRDYNCTKSQVGDQTCFDSFDKKRTCEPMFRSIDYGVCYDNISNYCLGNDLDDQDESWIERWTPERCGRVVQRWVYGCPITANGDVVNQGLNWSKQLMQDAFNKLISQGYSPLASPEDPSYNVISEVFHSVCKESPMACIDYLKENICNEETLTSVSHNSERLKWCGCYLPNSQYEVYNSLQLSTECSPTCNQQNTLKLVSPAGSSVIECTQDICIIDGITINIVNSQTGPIEINQVCGSCGDDTASCQCIIENNVLDIVRSEISGKIDFNQQCGSIEYSDPSSIDIPDNESLLIITIVIVIIILLFLIFLIVYIK